MKEKISLLVLFGGVSSEHEVSCVSAASVLEHIDSGKYHINTIGITKEGNWLLTSSPAVHIRDGSWQQDRNNRIAFISPDRSFGGILAEREDGTYERLPVDVVFPFSTGKTGKTVRCRGFCKSQACPL